MLVDPESPPMVSARFTATILWMSASPLGVSRPYLVKHTSRYVCGSVVRIACIIEPVSLERHASETLTLNQFAQVEIETHQPLSADSYDLNRITGAFILVEPISNEAVAAGMIVSEIARDAERSAGPPAGGSAPGMVLWFTGLSSAGKSSISRAVYEKLWAKGYRVELLDGDVVRRGLSKDLGFSREDRDENIRRIGFTAELLARNGVIVLVAAISPYRQTRAEVRARIANFIEVYVNAPIEVVEARDLKGIYRRARAGEIRGVTGIDDPYEPPLAPELECCTDHEALAESVEKVMEAFERKRAGP